MTDQPPVLVDFLRTEIRDNRRRCDGLLARIADVAAGRHQSVEMTGNLYLLTLTPAAARIDGLFDQTQSLTLSLQGLAEAVAAWGLALDR